MGYVEFKIREYKPKKKVLIINENNEKTWIDNPKEKTKWLTRKVYLNIEDISSIEQNYNYCCSKITVTNCKIITKNEYYYAQISYEKAKNMLNKQVQCGFKYKNKI